MAAAFRQAKKKAVLMCIGKTAAENHERSDKPWHNQTANRAKRTDSIRPPTLDFERRSGGQ